MFNSDKNGMGVVGTIAGILAIPYNLLAGLILGFVAPIAAIAAMVAGVRLLTGKMPFLSMQKEPGQERSLALTLVPPEQVKERFEEQKEEIAAELTRMQQEIRAIVEEAKAEARQTAAETAPPMGEEI
jgi:Na+-translocating ferredoxin:NAD+ oxidoreductase RnfG subunit